MKLVVQRVKSAFVLADGVLSGEIGEGLLVLLGVMEGDTEAECRYLAEKTAKLRIFSDDQDKLNLSVQDVGGSILVVSNFTLGGNCRKGTRPSYDKAAKQPISVELYERYLELLREYDIPVASGVFGAHMEIDMKANGPVTILMDTEEIMSKNHK